ncbi:26S protease regulatory subunit [Lasiodiplodia theobromae]|uniref:26S protease regulatory subunit n=1 Tax=Lasiodiplodia theobromae TaxID=45133 RepID=UPI0015C31423|nr:26S protease regulatory subunit [Lasiodiplodia theobromae]KAF4536406.1 26S protease regulatory subunit [Lasiodiplodia theobromae]
MNQKTHWDDVTPEHEFEELQLEICPPRVLGYHLENKTWIEMNVALDEPEVKDVEKPEGRFLRDIKQLISDQAFKALQLVKSQKDLIQDLVRSHASGTMAKPLLEDIIKGKGKGPPGVGKTLTAGVGDVGLDAQVVERNLQALFELAANWRAVLLFDEADVFLESRSSHTSDLNRNTLVSVLLRVLEYYDGILILTTNRIREFDVAVQSRVNLGIKYDDLDREQKIRIIDNFLKQLQDENVERRDEIREWFNDNEDGREQIKFLNGRQVRNILFSAASLATQDGMRLSLKHIQKMTKATFLFHDSIKTIVDDARRRAEARRD